jgi:hypothetical protein
LVYPVVAETQAEAEDRFALVDELAKPIDSLVLLSEVLNFDFAAKAPDEPLSDEELRAMTGIQAVRDRVMQLSGKPNPTVKDFLAYSGRGTLRELPTFVGTPTKIADQMEEWFAGSACDGFVIAATHVPSPSMLVSSVSSKIGKENWKAMANPNPNPKNRFKKGHAPLAGGGRPRGATNVLTRDIRSLLREAAANTGFMERVPVLDAAGKPTGQFEHRWGKDGELGYLEWLARNHPGYFASPYGKLIPPLGPFLRSWVMATITVAG